MFGDTETNFMLERSNLVQSSSSLLSFPDIHSDELAVDRKNSRAGYMFGED